MDVVKLEFLVEFLFGKEPLVFISKAFEGFFLKDILAEKKNIV